MGGWEGGSGADEAIPFHSEWEWTDPFVPTPRKVLRRSLKSTALHGMHPISLHIPLYHHENHQYRPLNADTCSPAAFIPGNDSYLPPPPSSDPP